MTDSHIHKVFFLIGLGIRHQESAPHSNFKVCGELKGVFTKNIFLMYGLPYVLRKDPKIFLFVVQDDDHFNVPKVYT